MPTSAQRFSGSATLDRCVDEGYRLLAGDPDHDAVWRLQAALLDLGYELDHGLDGAFGRATGEVVIEFKTDERLMPADAVASRGTIGRLDACFAREARDPDQPDPATTGLVDAFADASIVATRWIGDAVEAIRTTLDTPGGIPETEARLQRHFRLATAGIGRERALREVLGPAYLEARRALVTSLFEASALTRAQWHVQFPGEDYHAVTERLGGRVFISPPFRNALSADERAAAVAGIAIGLDGRIRGNTPPATRRYERLTGDFAVVNKPSYAAFAAESSTGATATFSPRPTWPEPHF